MKHRRERRYGFGELYFITCSCYRRTPLSASPWAWDRFLEMFREVPDRYDFGLFGYVVIPEHIHLLTSEPNKGNPSDAVAVLRQRISRDARQRATLNYRLVVLVNPSLVQSSDPTPLCTKNKPSGSYFLFTSNSRAWLFPQYALCQFSWK
jgi:REP element-mobilizing transposase RayT